METMQTMLGCAKREVVAAFRDDRGAEGLEKILIIAAIVLPLLGVLLYFRDQFIETSYSEYGKVLDSAGTLPTPPVE